MFRSGVEHEAVSRTVRPESLVLPHLPPQSRKVGAGKGGGGAGRTVMQMLFCWLGGPYCHANVSSLSLCGRGNAVLFLGFFFAFGSASFFGSFLRVAVQKIFSGANFCVGVSVLASCFSVAFCFGFCYMIWRFVPENVQENSLHIGVSVLVRSLFLRFSVVVVFCFCQDIQLRSDRAHPALVGLVPFSFLTSLRLAYRPIWPCALSFSRFVGVPLWAPGVWAFLDFLGSMGGLRSLTLSEAISWTRGGMGACV